MTRRLLPLSALLLVACTVEHTFGHDRAVHAEPPAPPAVEGPIAFGETREATGLGPDRATVFLVTGREGARVRAHGDNVVRGPFLLGPLTEDLTADVVARDSAAHALPAAGTYLVGAIADEGETFQIRLDCESGECRQECGPGARCPAESTCDEVQCVRAPCPSYCVPRVRGGEAPPREDPPAETPSSEDPPASGALCGTRGVGPCPEGEFCRWEPRANCGRADAPGVCEPVPEVCTMMYQPVCGCDGRTYGNACEAATHGISVDSEGACEE
jgi:hypothetical protein